jgi:nucleoside-diphosphate-sugar epimerase
MQEACEGVDAVIHLGGLSVEGPWEQILETNIHGSYVMFEAARRARVPRVIYASSSHAVGFHPRDGSEAPDYLYPRPDTYYGVSKAAGEALGSLYHDRYGLDVVCIRFGSCHEELSMPRQLATWLSPDDCARLLEAALTVPSPGFRLVWGISANTQRWFSLDEARSLGYAPRDDAELYTEEAMRGGIDPLDSTYLGGTFCSPELDAKG